MLYNVVVDEWGKTIYVPTTLGNVLLALIILALLAAAVIFAGKKAAGNGTGKPTGKLTGKLTAKQLAFCAAAIALGTVLSNIKLFRFATGGSITLLSMLMVALPGYWFGLEAGLTAAAAHGVLQLVTNPYVVHPAQLVVEYLLAFGILGLSGLFCNAKNGLLKGYAAGVAGRWFFASLSGWIFFKEYAWDNWNPLLYSMTYNGIYIFSEAAITLAVLAVPQVKAAFARVKKLAVE